MCGIGLVIHKNEKVHLSVFQDFMHTVLHRGPDHQAQVDLDGMGFIGTNRLAIIDQHERSHQPMIYKHLSLSFNGAIYNFKELRQHLVQRGYEFHTESDTEVVLLAYAEYGAECVHRLEGMWSFVIYDAEKKEVFGSRDRYGIKPFYYSLMDSAFWVGSELKQFRSVIESLTINQEQVQYYLDSGGFKNHSASTFYREVLQLEPGCSLCYSLSDHTCHITRYYRLEDAAQPEEGSLIEAIESAVRDRQIADVSPAMMFSGGLDSSILLLHLLRNQAQTNSYSFIERADALLDEGPFIQSFLSRYPHDNHQIEFPEQLDHLMLSCMRSQDEPPASLSAVAQYMLYSLAHRVGDKLMISGQGADELFGGYPRFMSFIPRIHYIGHPIESFQLLRKYGDKLWSRKSTSERSVFFKQAVFQQPQFGNQKEYMSYLFQKNGLRDLLHYEDRNSMAHRIETRLPFLDRKLVEYAYHLPIEVKMQGLRGKGILIESYREHLPSKIINRRGKLAFDTPEQRLLEAGMIDVEKSLLICMQSFPELAWNSKEEIMARMSTMQRWQIHFLSLWITLDN